MRFNDWKMPYIAHGIPTKYNWIVLYPEGLNMGHLTDIGAYTLIQARAGVEIGLNVQIGSHCAIYSVSTIDNRKGKVVIGQGAKIGTHSTVMPGVTIGDNAVIGAHSFVNRDIPAGEVWYGVPARKRKGGSGV